MVYSRHWCLKRGSIPRGRVSGFVTVNKLQNYFFASHLYQNHQQNLLTHKRILKSPLNTKEGTNEKNKKSDCYLFLYELMTRTTISIFLVSKRF